MAQRITYSGLLQLQGKPKIIPGSNARRYPAIRVGNQELFDIEIPQHLEQFLVTGQNIELTLNGISMAPAIFALAGVLAYFAGEIADIGMLSLIGTVLFVSSLAYWFLSFINSGHRIHAIKVNNSLYDENDFDYELPKSRPGNAERNVDPVSVSPPAATLPTPAEPIPASNEPTLAHLNQPHNGNGVHKANEDRNVVAELFAARQAAAPSHKVEVEKNTASLSKVFSTLMNETSTLVCPQCGIEALVAPDTRLICGNCKVWMQKM